MKNNSFINFLKNCLYLLEVYLLKSKNKDIKQKESKIKRKKWSKYKVEGGCHLSKSQENSNVHEMPANYLNENWKAPKNE